jgi:hypothetical protein
VIGWPWLAWPGPVRCEVELICCLVDHQGLAHGVQKWAFDLTLARCSWTFAFAFVVLQVQLTESCSVNQTPSQTNQADWLRQRDRPIALNLHAQGQTLANLVLTLSQAAWVFNATNHTLDDSIRKENQEVDARKSSVLIYDGYPGLWWVSWCT